MPRLFRVWICAFAYWLIRAFGDAPPFEVADPEREAVLDACAAVGLPMAQVNDDTDLIAAGKLVDVLHHAAAALGVEHGLRTVGDVVAFLKDRA